MVLDHRGWQRVLLLILPYLLVVGTFQYAGMIVADVDMSSGVIDLSSKQQVITSFFDLMGTFLLLAFFMKFIDKEKFIHLGFHTVGKRKDFFFGIFLGAFIMGGAFLFLKAINEIHFSELIVSLEEIIRAVVVFSIVAVVEEVLFRGYILRNLMISFNRYAALIISSALFALMHGFNPNIDVLSMVGLFLAGLVLGISYVFTKNLWFPIALHLSWNLFQSLFGFNVSGQDFYSLIEFKISKNNLLNGGAFGFEGSILSMLTEVLLIIAIGSYYRRKERVLKDEL